MLKFTFVNRWLPVFVLAIVYGLPVLAQKADTNKVSSAAILNDSRRRIWSDIDLQIGLDVSRLLLSAIEEKYFGADALAMIRFQRLYAVAEGGWLNRNLRQNDYQIATNGGHIRIGLEKNIFNNAEHKLFYGFRLAASRANYKAVYIKMQNEPFGGQLYVDDQVSKPLSAFWLEGVGGVQVGLVKHLFLGFTIRVRYKINNSNWVEYPYNWIPGYGHALNNTSLGLNYYVIYQFSGDN